MSEKAPVTGWIIQVLTPGQPDALPLHRTRRRDATLLGPPSFAYFNVAIADVAKAIEAVTKRSDSSGDLQIEEMRELSAREVSALNLKVGEVKPA